MFENLTVTSLAIDHQGTFFLGGRGEFGFLQPDSSGGLNYISLTPYLPENTKKITMVWEVCATTHGVYFRTSSAIFRWNGSDIKAWKTNTSFGYLAAVRDTIFVMEKGVGLQTLTGDSLQLIPGGKQFANTTLYVILPFDDTSKFFLGTRTEGIYVFDGRHIQRFKTEADAFFSENRLYHGVKLSGPETKWALATTRGGMVILDGQGKIRQALDKSLGLLDNKIHFVFEDRQKALWLSTNNGLSRVEIASSLTVFDKRLDFEGIPRKIVRHQGALFVAASHGLFRLGVADTALEQPQENLSQQKFRLVDGIPGQTWSLHATDGLLLVGDARGIYSVEEDKVEIITALSRATYCFYQPDGENYIFAGSRNGLVVLERKNSHWRLVGKLENTSEDVRTIVGGQDGSLWLGTSFQGVVQVKTNERSPLKSAVKKYGAAHGLAKGMAYTYFINNQLEIGSYAGLRQFDRTRQKFVPDSSLGNFLTDSLTTIAYLTQDKSGAIWAMAGRGKGKLYRGVLEDDSYAWKRTPFQRLLDMTFVLDIVSEKNGVVWLAGGDEKIYRFDSNITHLGDKNFPAHIRRVGVIPGDSTIWGGSHHAAVDNPELISILPFENNSLRFEYAASSYDATAANQYQIKLDGYDKEWLEWTSET